jgi:hypothetical protein
LKSFEWDPEFLKKEGFTQKYLQMRRAGILATLALLDAKKTPLATSLLEEIEYIWPSEILPFEWQQWMQVEAHLRLGNQQRATETAAAITATLKKQRPQNEAAIRLAAQQFDLYRKELERLATEYNLPELAVF